jgi:hypothetical protein
MRLVSDPFPPVTAGHTTPPRNTTTCLLLPTSLVLGLLGLFARHGSDGTPDLSRIHVLEGDDGHPGNLFRESRVQGPVVQSFKDHGRDLLGELDEIVLGLGFGFRQVGSVYKARARDAPVFSLDTLGVSQVQPQDSPPSETAPKKSAAAAASASSC